MQTHRIIKLVSAALTAIFIILFSTTASARIFAKIGDIEGEVTDARHPNWINVLAVSEGISRPQDGSVSGTRVRANATFSDIVIVKELDKSSPRLRQGLANGTSYPLVEIEITKSCEGGGQLAYFRYELNDVLITSVSLSGSSDDSRPTEQVSLNFERIKWTYTQDSNNGCADGGKVEASWNVVTGK